MSSESESESSSDTEECSEHENKEHESESVIYNILVKDDIHGPIIKESCYNIYIYKNLKSILPYPGQKGDLLSVVRFYSPAKIRITRNKPIHEAYLHKKRGLCPLMMVTTLDNQYNLSSNAENLEYDTLVQTSIKYPLRCTKYRKIMRYMLTNEPLPKFCLSTFIPNVALFRDDEYNFLKDICYINIGILYGTVYEDHDALYKIIRSRLNCIFDMAIQRQFVDTIIFTDMFCKTKTLVDLYVMAFMDLKNSYIFHFHEIVFAINDNELLWSALESVLYADDDDEEE